MPARQLSSSECEQVLVRHRDRLLTASRRAGVEPRAIIAFGSAAEDELREDSDLDIAIVFENAADLDTARSSIVRAPRIDEWPLDLLFYTTSDFETRAENGGVCMVIRDEGRVLFSLTEDKQNESQAPGT